MSIKKYVSYHNRHTDRPAVTRFVNYNEGTLVGEYVEGKRKWPFLLEAIEKCKEAGATLVVAKIGRLVRNQAFLKLLQESTSTSAGYSATGQSSSQSNPLLINYPS